VIPNAVQLLEIRYAMDDFFPLERVRTCAQHSALVKISEFVTIRVGINPLFFRAEPETERLLLITGLGREREKEKKRRHFLHVCRHKLSEEIGPRSSLWIVIVRCYSGWRL